MLQKEIKGWTFKSHFLLESGTFDIFEIVMVSKLLHFHNFASCMVNMNCWLFFKFWWLIPKLRLIKIWGYFHQKLKFWLEEQLWHKLYSEANIGTQGFFLNIHISWIYVTKNEKPMCTCWLLTLATLENKICKIDPTLNVII